MSSQTSTTSTEEEFEPVRCEALTSGQSFQKRVRFYVYAGTGHDTLTAFMDGAPRQTGDSA